MGRKRRKHGPSYELDQRTVIPYDTGKLKIGQYYEPPRRVTDMGKHAELLQSVLLGVRVPWYQRLSYKIFGIPV